jgi:phage terminase small subunit
MDRLTDKQARFCEEYLKDLNSTKAALRSGYSAKTCRAIGCENLTKPIIQERIRKKIKQISEDNEITVERIVKEIASAAFSNVADLFDESGNLKDMKELEREVAAAISSIDISEISTAAISSIDISEISTAQGEIGTTTKIRLWDKLKALEMLARYMRIFEGEKAPETATQVNIAQMIQNIQSMSTEQLLEETERRLREVKQQNLE